MSNRIKNILKNVSQMYGQLSIEEIEDYLYGEAVKGVIPADLFIIDACKDKRHSKEDETMYAA